MVTARLKTRKPRKLYRYVGKVRRDNIALPAAGEFMRQGVDPPVATGELAASIATEKLLRSFRIVVQARHGKFVEFGTSKTPPQPFLRTAFRTRRDGAVKTYIKAIKRHNK